MLTQAPWGRLGTTISELNKQSISGAITESKLDWTVKKAPLAIMSRDGMIEQGATPEIADSFLGCHNRFVNKFAVVRSDNNEDLDVVGPDYTLIQNSDCFNWFQPFLDSNEASLEACGQLYNGSKVWILAKINRDDMDIGGGDNVSKFLLLSNSHDGSQSMRVGFTPIRIRCTNQLSMVHRSKESSLIRLRHSRNIQENLLAIRETIDTLNQEFEATGSEFRKLMNRGINQSDLRKYCKVVLDVPLELADKDIPTRTQNRLEDLVRLCTSGIGNDGKTWWSAYQGVTEQLSWNQGRSVDSRMDSLWFGTSSNLNNKALKLALEMSA